MREAFLKEWRAIDSRYPALTEAPEGMALDEHWNNLAALRSSARQALRHEIHQALAKGFGGGNYPIAI